MKALKYLSVLLATAGIGVVLSAGTTASAKALNYRALTYGTNKTSMASGYFVHPASVKVKSHKYVVTMRIKTAKKLSSFPVRVLSVNGGKPQHVRKVKDRAGNSNLYYSFTTKNLKHKINAKLAINVPKVYKATHNITFKFSTSGLPSLKGKAATTSAATKATTSHSTQTNAASASSKPDNGSVKKIDNGAKTTNSSSTASVQSTKTSDSQSSSQPVSSSSSQVSSAAASHVNAASTDNRDQSQTQSRLPFLIAGVVVIVLIVLGGSLVVMRKKR